MFTGEQCPKTRFKRAEILLLAGNSGAGGMAPPTNNRISARLKCVQEHSSPVNVSTGMSFKLVPTGKQHGGLFVVRASPPPPAYSYLHCASRAFNMNPERNPYLVSTLRLIICTGACLGFHYSIISKRVGADLGWFTKYERSSSYYLYSLLYVLTWLKHMPWLWS